MGNKPANNKKPITKDEMVKAIERSGYLIERRVAKLLKSKSYDVIENHIYFDSITKKRRELDAVAIKINWDDNRDRIGYELICECENNVEPIVFFPIQYELFTYLEGLKYSGFLGIKRYLIDAKIESKINIKDTMVASQYSVFNDINSNNIKKDSEWIAYHSDKKHESFSKLISAIKHRIEVFEPKRDLKSLFGRIHYPLIILNDNMYCWNDDTETKLTKIQSLKYRIGDYNEITGLYENYYVDVISESYLEEYIMEKEDEWNVIKPLIIQYRDIIVQNYIQGTFR